MSPKIQLIAIASSPEKGLNSDTMLDHFLTGVNQVATKNPHLNTEKIYLSDIDFALYDHLHTQPDPEKEKDFFELIQKIKNANALVIATPTYNFNVPAKLKNLIDRMSTFALDYKNLNKFKQPTGQLGYLKTFFLVSGGASNFVQKFIFFLYPAFWLKAAFLYYGAPLGKSLFGGNLTFRKQAKDRPKLLKKCEKAGAKFAQKILKRTNNIV